VLKALGRFALELELELEVELELVVELDDAGVAGVAAAAVAP
jgi:hypothetical protein